MQVVALPEQYRHFVPNDIVTLYKTEMEKVFGDGACDVLKNCKYGGIQVM